MNQPNPNQLQNMEDVTRYWSDCATQLQKTPDDKLVASAIVAVVGNKHDDLWYRGSDSHPAYSIIFELHS
ncbi:MAG: hypothetical protein ACQR33_00165 [Candidatus Saccharibacteria bacterium]